MKIKYTIFCLFIVKSLVIYAQDFKGKTYTLDFDKTGVLLIAPPERLLEEDCLDLKVPKDEFNIYETKLKSKAKAALNTLKKLDKNQNKILNDIYGIADLKDLIEEYKKIITNASDNTKAECIPHYIASDKDYIGFSSNEIAWKTTTEIATYSREGNLNFILIKKNPYNIKVNEWFKEGDYGANIDFTKIRDLRKKAEKAMVQIEKLKINEINPDTIKKLTKTFREINFEFEEIKKDFREKATWIKKCLWYTEGKPILNPFPFMNPNEFEAPIFDELESWKSKKAVRDTLINNLKYTAATRKQVDSLINERKLYSDSISDATRKIAKYNKHFKSNQSNIYSFSTISQNINEVSLAVTKMKAQNPNRSPIFWMRHHDAANELREMNPTSQTEYLSSDRVMIITHNVKYGDTILYKEKVITIEDDRPQWVIDLTKAIDGLDDIKVLDNPKMAVFPKKAENEQILINQRLIKAALDSLKIQTDNYKSNEPLLEYMAMQHNPYFDFKTHADSIVSFHSDFSNHGKKREGTKEIKYWVKTTKSKTLPDTISYRVNKTYAILPAAGVAYTNTQFTNIELNEANTAVVKQKNYNDLGVYAGLKFHIFRKMDTHSTKFIFGKDSRGNSIFPSRLNLFAGVGIIKPIENIYIGGGLDLIPGLSLNVGTHLNRYTEYKFVNGKADVEDKKYRAGFYFGILTDVSLATSIINLFK